MSNLTRYEPFEDFFKGFFVRPFTLPTEASIDIKIDVKEDDKTYTIRAEIPGAKKDDIKVDIDRNLVSLSAEVRQEKEEKKGEKIVYSERSYGMASRSFTLPGEVDAAGARAEYKDGLLSLTLPKKANGSGQRIAIA